MGVIFQTFITKHRAVSLSRKKLFNTEVTNKVIFNAYQTPDADVMYVSVCDWL